MPDYEKLIERLKRHDVLVKGEPMVIDMLDGRGGQKVLTGDTVQLRNPDGPEAAEAISTLLKEREWQPIETAPRDETPIDVWFVGEDGDTRRVTDVYWNGRRWADPNSEHEHVCLDAGDVVTHWMPLPAPPKAPTTAAPAHG